MTYDFFFFLSRERIQLSDVIPPKGMGECDRDQNARRFLPHGNQKSVGLLKQFSYMSLRGQNMPVTTYIHTDECQK